MCGLGQIALTACTTIEHAFAGDGQIGLEPAQEL
jgi:hypothetical protein